MRLCELNHINSNSIKRASNWYRRQGWMKRSPHVTSSARDTGPAPVANILPHACSSVMTTELPMYFTVSEMTSKGSTVGFIKRLFAIIPGWHNPESLVSFQMVENAVKYDILGSVEGNLPGLCILCWENSGLQVAEDRAKFWVRMLALGKCWVPVLCLLHGLSHGRYNHMFSPFIRSCWYGMS